MSDDFDIDDGLVVVGRPGASDVGPPRAPAPAPGLVGGLFGRAAAAVSASKTVGGEEWVVGAGSREMAAAERRTARRGAPDAPPPFNPPQVIDRPEVCVTVASNFPDRLRLLKRIHLFPLTLTLRADYVRRTREFEYGCSAQVGWWMVEGWREG